MSTVKVIKVNENVFAANDSEDSRLANIGNVKKSYIIGKAWFYFKSIGNMGFIH